MSRVDRDAFALQTEPLRRELLAHCYRMLGSFESAEDLVQETLLRAWKAFPSFEGRSSLRTWLYKIATNACLTAVRRVLPSGLGNASHDPHAAHPVPEGVAWIEPFPDAAADSASEPPAIAESRGSLRLALIAALQWLTPRQRAVLLLREVLEFTAAETASVLGFSVPAVKSALQRARAKLDAGPAADLAEPSGPEARDILERYIDAFERSDPRAMERLLCEDAAIETPPSGTWFAGKTTCVAFLSAYALGSAGDWRMIPTAANGQPAAIAYRRLGNTLQPFGVAVLTVRAEGIARVTVFQGPAVVARFLGTV
jgi:RNA polymerase sigma-70 factor (ECF subfamily)